MSEDHLEMSGKCQERDFQDLPQPSSSQSLSNIDSSTNQNESTLFHPFGRPENFEEDHYWSLLSNSVFLFAGISYVCLSIWDVFFYPTTTQDDSINPLNGAQKYAYSTIIGCGVVGYFVDSIIDVIWAKRIRQRVKAKKRMMRQGNEGDNVKQNKKRRFRIKKLRRKIMVQMDKIRKHAAHRRDYYAACFFGAASSAALLDWLYDLINRKSRPPFNILSVHFYLLSAIFALTGTRARPILFTFSLYDPDFLEDMGDIFFLVGSLVDTTLCDFHFDDRTVKWELLSAFLWALDASLYLRSDAVIGMELRKEKYFQQLYNEVIDKEIYSKVGEMDDDSYYEMSELESN